MARVNPRTGPPAQADAGATLTLPNEPGLSPAGRRMASRLRELRAKLDTVTHCHDTCCTGGYTEFRSATTDEPALREVLSSEQPAPVRGLAAIHLRHLWNHNVDIVPALDDCVTRDQPAGLIPDDSEPSQLLTYCSGSLDVDRGPLTWSPRTLGELCLQTANAITSLNLSREQYRAWRREYPDPRDSWEMWQALFRAKRPVEETLLAELEGHSRQLYVRVLLTHPEGLDGLGLDPNRIASCLPGVVTSADLVVLLEHPTRWPELANAERQEAFARNLLVQWRILLGEQAAPHLERLWDAAFGNDRPSVRYNLAWAVADAVPARRRAILKAGLNLPSVDPTRILERLASDYASAEKELLIRWFESPATSEFSREAILDGLAHATPPPKHLFRELLARVAANSAVLIRHAAVTAKAVGCELPPSACEGLSPWFGKRALGEEERDKISRRAQDAQRECYAALQRCSSQW